MGKRAIHMFSVDFDKLKQGQIYSSLCGKRYIAEEPPTPEECVEIQERTKDSPICRTCEREKKKLVFS